MNGDQIADAFPERSFLGSGSSAMSEIATRLPQSRPSAFLPLPRFRCQMCEKPSRNHDCAEIRCFTRSKLPAGADFRSITKLIGYTSSQFAKVITAVLGKAGNYQARGCPPTRLAAADSISFKSACVRAPAASIFRINSSNRAARKCISRRSEPVSSPSVFTSMRRSLFAVHFRHGH